MPKFFFHVFDGKHSVDDVGTELSGAEEARTEAIQAAGRMLTETDPDFWNGTCPWTMHVVDTAGSAVCDLAFSAAFVRLTDV